MALSFEQFYDKYSTKSGGASVSSPNTQTTFQEYYEKYGTAGSGSTVPHPPKTFRQFYKDPQKPQHNFLGNKIPTAVSDLESSKITADEFKSRIGPYRSYLGDDVTNQIFAEVDKYETGKAFSNAAKNFENGVTSVPEFKTELEKYRSFLGDDKTNQIISEVDQYGREYPVSLYNYYIQQMSLIHI